jgi:NAD+ synthase (glutamine-hydrolysing)
VADPAFNVERTIGLARRAHAEHAAVVLFPELGISAYTCEDLFHQDALLGGVERALGQLLEASRTLRPVLVVGAPLRFEGKLFNCGVVIAHGRVLGVVPKTYLPNYREFYERRQFTPGHLAQSREVRLLDAIVPFGNDLVFGAAGLDGFELFVEVCEDVWVPVPPSTWGTLAGASIVANLSASNITVGKADWRKTLCAARSGTNICAYLYSAAGPGESTTDLAWDGHAFIYENADLLAESRRFADEEQVILADVDLQRLAQDRMRMTSFNDAAGQHGDRIRSMRRVTFDFDIPAGAIPLRRPLERLPFVPGDPRVRDERCFEVYNIQVHGLMQRLKATEIRKVVLGISGGLDSTQALIVAARTMDRLGLPRSNILAYTMPGFATGEHTRRNAIALMDTFGTTAGEIDIRPSAMQMLNDLGHPFARGEKVYDLTFENVQAGERTSHLFRLANHHGGLVVGTGDLSELALGWTTYGVGDQMSHYAVNTSVPKTLIRHLIRWAIDTSQFDERTSEVLREVVATEISPELIPGDAEGGRPAQRSEATVGPYDLQDFHLYFITRFGFRPSKVAFLASQAWGDTYDLPTIRHWLEVFLKRFFATSQFKRSALPNGPKVGSGGSLSPRGDWRAPSDASAEVWLDELHRNVPE